MAPTRACSASPWELSGPQRATIPCRDAATCSAVPSFKTERFRRIGPLTERWSPDMMAADIELPAYCCPFALCGRARCCLARSWRPGTAYVVPSCGHGAAGMEQPAWSSRHGIADVEQPGRTQHGTVEAKDAKAWSSTPQRAQGQVLECVATWRMCIPHN